MCTQLLSDVLFSVDSTDLAQEDTSDSQTTESCPLSEEGLPPEEYQNDAAVASLGKCVFRQLQCCYHVVSLQSLVHQTVCIIVAACGSRCWCNIGRSNKIFGPGRINCAALCTLLLCGFLVGLYAFLDSLWNCMWVPQVSGRSHSMQQTLHRRGRH